MRRKTGSYTKNKSLYDGVMQIISECDQGQAGSFNSKTTDILLKIAELFKSVAFDLVEEEEKSGENRTFLDLIGKKQVIQRIESYFLPTAVHQMLNIAQSVNLLVQNTGTTNETQNQEIRDWKYKYSDLQAKLYAAEQDANRNYDIFLRDMQLNLEIAHYGSETNAALLQIQHNVIESLEQFGVRVLWEASGGYSEAQMFTVYSGDEKRVRPCLLSSDGRILLKGYIYRGGK